MADSNKRDVVDDDLYEEIPEEELIELVEKARIEALNREKLKKEVPKRKLPKWSFWLIAIVMLFNVVALMPQTFSIPAIDFLITSAKLSVQDDIRTYKKAVAVIETGDSKGTGFAITADGKIVTNYHVIEGETTVTAAFPDDGLFSAEVMATYPEFDLAVLQATNADDLPHLKLAKKTIFNDEEEIYFIGNPLKFHGIANKGSIIDYTSLQDWGKYKVVMMKAPVYRGNSGSPVINNNGQVIGIVFATMEDEIHGKVGLFVPIDYLNEKMSNNST